MQVPQLAPQPPIALHPPLPKQAACPLQGVSLLLVGDLPLLGPSHPPSRSGYLPGGVSHPLATFQVCFGNYQGYEHSELLL